MVAEGESDQGVALLERRRVRRAWIHRAALFLVLASVSLGCGAGRASAAMQNSPVPYVTQIYVSPFGSDTNTGYSWDAAKATIAGALAVLPNCTVAGVRGSSGSILCGTIYLSAGQFPMTTGVTITSPGVSIIGQGAAQTEIVYTGTGCAITLDTGAGSALSSQVEGGIYDGFTIDGTGDSNPSACGLIYQDHSSMDLRDITIANFTASGDACLIGASGVSWDERVDARAVWLGNCTQGWRLQNTLTSGAQTTLGYGFFDLFINVESGQTGVVSVGDPAVPLQMWFNVFHIIENLDSSTATCADLSVGSWWTENTGVWHCEGPKGATGFVVDSTSYFYFGGSFTDGGPDKVASGGDMQIYDLTTMPTGGFYPRLMMEAPATKSTPGKGPSFVFDGQYWDGSASSRDEWKFQQIPSGNSSFLSIQHTMGPGPGVVGVPELNITPGGGYGGRSTNVIASSRGYYNFKLPPASGTAALQGANGISAGTITLYGGSGSHTFGSAYKVVPICTATDTSRVAPVKVTISTTELYVTGSGSDLIAWICTPAAN